MAAASAAAAAGVAAGIGSAASGPLASGINAHMYKKYTLNEPIYRAMAQRKAGINPLLANAGELAAPPPMDIGDMGSIGRGVGDAIKDNQEVKLNKLAIDTAVNTERKSWYEMMNAQMQNTYQDVNNIDTNLGAKLYWQQKVADLNLTNAQKSAWQHENVGRKAEADMWQDLGKYGKFGKLVFPALQTIIGKGRK